MNTLVISDINFLEVDALNDASVYGGGGSCGCDTSSKDKNKAYRHWIKLYKKGNGYKVLAEAKGLYVSAKIEKNDNHVSSKSLSMLL